MPRHGDQHPAAVQRRPPLEPRSSLSPAVADDLLSAAGQGDVGALGAFFDQTAPAVFGLLRTALGGTALAEEAAERVYLRLWRTSPGFDPAGGSAYSLLLRAARRELVDGISTLVSHNRAPSPSTPVPPVAEGGETDGPNAPRHR